MIQDADHDNVRKFSRETELVGVLNGVVRLKPDAGRCFGSEVSSLKIFQKYARYAKKHVNNGICVAVACPPEESKAYLHLNAEFMLAAMQIAFLQVASKQNSP